MKRLFFCCIFLLIILMFAGCGNSNKTNESTSETTTNVTTEKVEISILDTEYYTLKIPNSWNDKYFCETIDGEMYSYSLYFYEKTSREDTGGGLLFSINLMTVYQDYTTYPNYDFLGSLDVYRIGCYNLIVMYPTDMQYDENTAEEYIKLSKDIPDIVQSISFKNDCTFSKEPTPIIELPTEPPKPQISKAFIGKWQDLGIGSRAPSNATRWNVEFRDDGTGTFEFIFEEDDIVTTDFEFEPYDTYLGEAMDGIRIKITGGNDILFMTKYTWSNEMQKLLMTMFEVKNNGTPNLNVFWVFANS